MKNRAGLLVTLIAHPHDVLGVHVSVDHHDHSASTHDTCDPRNRFDSMPRSRGFTGPFARRSVRFACGQKTDSKIV